MGILKDRADRHSELPLAGPTPVQAFLMRRAQEVGGVVDNATVRAVATVGPQQGLKIEARSFCVMKPLHQLDQLDQARAVGACLLWLAGLGGALGRFHGA